MPKDHLILYTENSIFQQLHKNGRTWSTIITTTAGTGSAAGSRTTAISGPKS